MMRTSLVSALAILAASIGASTASAQSWYGRVDAGYSFDSELDLDSRTLRPSESELLARASSITPRISTGGAADLDDGWSGHVGIGRAFANGFRLEGEAAYRQNDISRSANYAGDSEATSWAAMLNGYYDFNRAGRVQPYIGLGVGVAEVDAQFTDPSPGVTVDDDATGFAYQGLIGLALKASERVTFDLGYRYFAARDLEFSSSIGDYEGDYVHQAATLGLRIAFGQAAAPVVAPPPEPTPPAPPVAPPAPPVKSCVPAQFTVYFDWDRSVLNADGEATIARAVEDASGCNYADVTVAGHTDRSGSAAYNNALSQRRAAIVRDALVARGVPASAITTQNLGEGQPAKATADGVREPLNRRTAVSISFR